MIWPCLLMAMKCCGGTSWSQQIDSMKAQGYDCDYGPHCAELKGRGFYATFFKPDVGNPRSWCESGHGWSLLDAILMAQKMAFGEKCYVSSNVFEEETDDPPEEDPE